MARAIMGGDFRAIRRQPVAPGPDPRLALVDLFKGTQVVPVDGLALAGLLTEDAQEPAEEPAADSADNGEREEPALADEAPAHAEPVAEPPAPEPSSKDEDYDPIAAVLG